LQLRILATIDRRIKRGLQQLWYMTAAIIVAILVTASGFALFPEGYPPPGSAATEAEVPNDGKKK
jgi:predicted benzoate:H+ symporter BenE